MMLLLLLLLLLHRRCVWTPRRPPVSATAREWRRDKMRLLPLPLASLSKNVAPAPELYKSLAPLRSRQIVHCVKT